MAAPPCQSPGEVASVRAAVQAQMKELTASVDKAVKELPPGKRMLLCLKLAVAQRRGAQ